jgi:hypothetical protein
LTSTFANYYIRQLPIYIGFGSNPDNDSRTNGGPGAYVQAAPDGPGGGLNHRLRGKKGVCPGKCDQGGEGEHAGLLHTGAR